MKRLLDTRGQILVITAGILTLLIALVGLVVDLGAYQNAALRVQRAADAAALAGVVSLPANPTGAYALARAEAGKNGYQHGLGPTVVTPEQDSGNSRRLNVTISTEVDTFFARIIGFNTLDVVREASAEYIRPIPMGSPLNYYGVYKLCRVSGSSITCPDLPGATGGTLASQGFFGAIEGQGANRSTGDAYATGYNPRTTPNADYDPDGYDYEVEVPQDGGAIYVFDPTFCATTSGPGGGHLGTGDHWINNGSVNAVPVSTYYMLWDTHGTVDTTDDTRADTTTDDTLFTNEYQVDKSTAYAKAAAAGGADDNFADGREPGTNGTPSPTDCRSGATTNTSEGRYWHNRWWPIASNLSAGTYRLQIATTSPTNPTLNEMQMFENMWSLQVVGGGNPKVHGLGRMVSYANIQSGQQEFFLAQIDQAVGAGKTLEINLFDPGDVGDKAWLQILDPDGNVYTPATFSYTADANAAAGHQAGTNLTCIQTYGNGSGTTPPSGCSNLTSGGQYYGNSWITILIPLPASYGSTGLVPSDPENPRGEPGWWKIRYTVNSGNDTTTWSVALRGNPVHLVP
jgi:Flp pilus assembly protein TadG